MFETCFTAADISEKNFALCIEKGSLHVRLGLSIVPSITTLIQPNILHSRQMLEQRFEENQHNGRVDPKTTEQQSMASISI
jgi:hypothetical protein